MVVSVVGFTLVQVPNRLAGHSREQVRQLVELCYAHGRAFLHNPYKSATIDRSEINPMPVCCGVLLFADIARQASSSLGTSSFLRSDSLHQCMS